MTNDKLTQRHLEAIEKNCTITEGLQYNYISGRNKAASACTTISLELMEGFAEWVGDNYTHVNVYGVTYFDKSGKRYTTKQLVELYLNQNPTS